MDRKERRPRGTVGLITQYEHQKALVDKDVEMEIKIKKVIVEKDVETKAKLKEQKARIQTHWDAELKNS